MLAYKTFLKAEKRSWCLSAAPGLSLHVHSNKPACFWELLARGCSTQILQCSTLDLEVVQAALVNKYCRPAEQATAKCFRALLEVTARMQAWEEENGNMLSWQRKRNLSSSFSFIAVKSQSQAKQPPNNKSTKQNRRDRRKESGESREMFS